MTHSKLTASGAANVTVLRIEFLEGMAPRSLGGLVPGWDRERSLVVDPLSRSFGARGLEMPLQAACVLRELSAMSTRVGAIMCYCSGIVLAREIARCLTTPSPIVALDPQVPSNRDVEDLFAGIVGGIGSDANAYPYPLPTLTHASHAERLELLDAALVRAARHAAPDLPDDLVGQLVGRQRSWLAYCVAALQTAPPLGPEYSMLSRDSEWVPGPGHSLVRFDVSGEELFEMPEVRAEVARILTRELNPVEWRLP
ncbi:MAG: hypothetical protein ACRDFX_06855 [Chloroflexota bacterium]